MMMKVIVNPAMAVGACIRSIFMPVVSSISTAFSLVLWLHIVALTGCGDSCGSTKMLMTFLAAAWATCFPMIR